MARSEATVKLNPECRMPLGLPLHRGRDFTWSAAFRSPILSVGRQRVQAAVERREVHPTAQGDYLKNSRPVAVPVDWLAPQEAISLALWILLVWM